MATLEERVQRIEAENRRLRWLVVGLISAVAVLGLAGMRARTADPEEIRARSFVAVDERGRESVRIVGGDPDKLGGQIRMTGKVPSRGLGRDYDDLLIWLWAGGVHVRSNEDEAHFSADRLWFSRQRGEEVPLELSPDLISLVGPMPEGWTPPAPATPGMKPAVTLADAWRRHAPGVRISARSEPPGGRLWISNSRGSLVATIGADKEGCGEFRVVSETAPADQALDLPLPPPHRLTPW